MKNIGKPCAGTWYARFDEGGQEKRTMARLLRYRQTKGAAADRLGLRDAESCSLLYPLFVPTLEALREVDNAAPHV